MKISRISRNLPWVKRYVLQVSQISSETSRIDGVNRQVAELLVGEQTEQQAERANDQTAHQKGAAVDAQECRLAQIRQYEMSLAACLRRRRLRQSMHGRHQRQHDGEQQGTVVDSDRGGVKSLISKENPPDTIGKLGSFETRSISAYPGGSGIRNKTIKKRSGSGEGLLSSP